MPSKLFGVDLRLSSPNGERQIRSERNTPKSSPRLSPRNSPVTDLRRSSLNAMDHIKRPSLAGLKKTGSKKEKKDRSLSKDKDGKDQRSPLTQKSVKIGMYMESPPVLLIGTPQQSPGAIISGRLQVTPSVMEATIESMTMYLECTTSTKRPVSDRCRECMTQIDDLFEWHFFTQSKTFKAENGVQELPFSHMLPGTLPATTHGHIGSIEYSLHVKAKASDGQWIEFRRPLSIQRALLPGNDKNSVRIFPPTSLTLHVTVPNTVHPIGEFPVYCKMEGITNKHNETQQRWRLRKLTWRIEENEAMVSPACPKHIGKVGGEGNGVKHENTRQIGWVELKEGWKTDFDEGVIEGEFKASIDTTTKSQCGMEAQNGLKISHNLILELVIAEEWAQNKKTTQPTPTGAARVLRTQFSLNVTERAGMGLSWDDEQPPMYEDVPVSPPHYQGEHTTIADYEGDDLHEDVEHMALGP
ncbi:Endocytosis regulator [Vermiconidia calcicola]|uniref:Endocytosis regulator n=1 Tax=Vermiconidia calcicola TaxID=1690605 RepID=A0ACC3MCL5_9PEZI|nr:Endocytosis regulator [Vermiconidia calcicola]